MNDFIPPMTFAWNGEALVALNGKLADRHFVVGETYRMVEHHERTSATHRHYFACLADAWENLPEHLAERFPTSEHLRKFALIRAGYRDERTIVASSRAEARRLAAFVTPLDTFAIVTVAESTVSVFTAKSQSHRAMGARDFQASKTAVLDVLANMIGVQPETLSREAGRAA